MRVPITPRRRRREGGDTRDGDEEARRAPDSELRVFLVSHDAFGCLPADGVISRPRATCSTHHCPVGVLLAVCEPRRPGLDLVVSDNAVCAESRGTKLGVGGAHSCVSGASRASAPQVRPWTCFCLVVLTHGTRQRDALGVRCPRNNSTERRSMLGCTVKCSANMGRASNLCCCFAR